MCQVHFTSDSFEYQSGGRLLLSKGAVPTIFFRKSALGLEKIEVPYDQYTKSYVARTSWQNMKGSVCFEDEQALVTKRQQKLKELKSMCRFCFRSHIKIKCITLAKLETYQINPADTLSTMGMNVQYSECFSEIICEKCFQKVVDIDLFKKKCRKLQDDLVLDLKEMDAKIQEIRSGSNRDQKWFKSEPTSLQIQEAEEELEENFVNDDDFHYSAAESSDDEGENFEHSAFQTIYIKKEPKNELNEMDITDSESDGIEELIPTKKSYKKPKITTKDKYKDIDSSGVIKNPDRNNFCNRIYECFFCCLKFAGKTTYRAHECTVKERRCSIAGCEKSFKKINVYNFHITKVHELERVSRKVCLTCKSIFYRTEEELKNHKRECEKEHNDKNQVIVCEICEKRCANVQNYNVHKLFHDSRNMVNIAEQIVGPARKEKKKRSAGKGPAMCELCGNGFTNSQGLRKHLQNVHLVDSKGELYQCDHCGKTRPTKRLLYNHMRNVHRVQVRLVFGSY